MDTFEGCDLLSKGHGSVKEDIREDFQRFVKMESDFPKFEIDERADSNLIINYYGLSLSYLLNRCLYPVDMTYNAEESSSVFSLLILCCKEITRNANFLKRVFTFLPINRHELFMKTAICNGFRDSAAFLMSKWTSNTISTSVINSNTLLRYAMWKLDCGDILAKRLILLWTLFFEAVKNDFRSHLRILDLRGVPLDNQMMNYLIRKIFFTSREVLRPDQYHIIVDCEISSTGTIKLLTALGNMRQWWTRINPVLHINSIDVTRLNETTCSLLFQQVDPTDLMGIRLRSDFTNSFYKDVFTRFLSLTRLDIPAVMTSQAHLMPLHLIPNLRRLGIVIGHYNISNLISTSLLRRLEYLTLGGRRYKYMVDVDFQYLMLAPLSLVELDMSKHVIMSMHLNIWRVFLLSLAPTLKVLVLSECFVKDDVFPSMVGFLLPLTKLRYLNLGTNKLSKSILCKNLALMKKMPNAKGLRVDFLDEFGAHVTVDVHSESIFEMLQHNLIDGKFVPSRLGYVLKYAL